MTYKMQHHWIFHQNKQDTNLRWIILKTSTCQKHNSIAWVSEVNCRLGDNQDWSTLVQLANFAGASGVVGADLKLKTVDKLPIDFWLNM